MVIEEINFYGRRDKTQWYKGLEGNNRTEMVKLGLGMEGQGKEGTTTFKKSYESLLL